MESNIAIRNTYRKMAETALEHISSLVFQNLSTSTSSTALSVSNDLKKKDLNVRTMLQTLDETFRDKTLDKKSGDIKKNWIHKSVCEVIANFYFEGTYETPHICTVH